MHPNRLEELVTPSAVGFLFYITLATLALLIGGFTDLFKQLLPVVVQNYARQTLHDGIANFFNRLNGLVNLGPASTFLLWMMAGVLIYIVLWLVINSYIAFRNDVVVATTYTNFNTHGRVVYWTERILRGIFRLCACLMIIALLYIVVQLWYPFAAILFSTWIGALAVPINWLYLVEAFLGWLVVFHLLTILVRLVFLRTRLFG